MKIAIVTNKDHSPLGWGTTPQSVTVVADVLRESDTKVYVLDVPDRKALEEQHETINDMDLVWPNAYHYQEDEKVVSLPRSLESIGARLIGPGSESLETMLLKERCQEKLRDGGASTPKFVSVNGESPDEIERMINNVNLQYPVIVKSAEGSISRGILPDSVKETKDEIPQYIERLRSKLGAGNILVEEYVDGPEFTVAILGNGDTQKIYAVYTVISDPRVTSRKYKFMDGETRPGGIIRGDITLEPVTKQEEVEKLKGVAEKVYSSLGLSDWTRFDGRFDKYGVPKVFDVNGMPGLSFDRSITPQQFSVLYPGKNKEEVFQGIVYSIVHSAATRHGIHPPPKLTKNALYLHY
ncbi:hypothetical protein HOL21_03730 [Candidatus Woesearchaeota archaeon]|jgi:D-alanine-D-alanine ligase-like ATP-grasp enzyme|nr:hypothetical protein [Candidatus Woesearchaeota archaeon]MBT5397295.1 hypothetical protein [Candidatus Woesearchaeota archaeon]MBT5924280.1 hypothetical protein [Candidatus Woesearchaeota archaeon]MBT6367860.1 hypothetical protein [Candidatus Woesearchaeota archaeon]MBT7762695.1 hypothetical protein [Candidatus Woesearchaeota archaeon]